VKAEFHVHTRYSKDSIMPLWVICAVCKLKKIKCIAITDHNEIAGALKFKEKFTNNGINVVVGEEIFTSEGEIIGLYLNKKIEPNLSAIETVAEIKKQHGLVYIPHPYDEKRYKTVLKADALDKIIDNVDFIECHNGRNIKDAFSDKQDAICNKYNKTKIIGSDAHTAIELGRNYLKISTFDKNELVNEVKNAEFIMSKCLKSVHFMTKFSRFLKLVLKGEFNELYGIINRKFKKRK